MRFYLTEYMHCVNTNACVERDPLQTSSKKSIAQLEYTRKWAASQIR